MRRLLVVGGAALLVAPWLTGPAGATPDPGSGFGLFSLAARAPGVQVVESDASTCYRTRAADNGCEAVVPEAVSTLRSGPIGHGLAAVVWPGGLPSGAGSLLITAGGSSVPPQATLLNDPVRADAYTSVGSPTVSNSAVPGATMTATALPTRVAALAAVGRAVSFGPGTTGGLLSRTSVALTGTSSAVAVAHSEVRDLTVAGVLHVRSVVSDSRANTDGVHATAQGTTTVVGASVAGTAVTVDQSGVHVAGNGSGTSDQQQAVDAALSRAGVQVALGQPGGRPQGGSVDHGAPSLVVAFTNATGFTTTVVVGGADVSVAATPGFAPGQHVLIAPVASSPASGSLLPALSGGPGLAVQGASPQHLAPAPALASALVAGRLPEPGPLPTRTVVLVLGGALLLAAGLRRAPDQVLRQGPVACRTEEAS